MKGPGLRVDLDVRRVWRCGKCGRVVRTLGQVTAQRCGCTSDPPQWMHLEPAVKKEPFCAPHREHLPEEWEVEASSAPPSEQPTAAETPAELEPPAAEIPAQPLEQPACVPLPTATVVEYIAAEVLEVVIEGPAADPAVPPPDAFGAGVEDPPRDPDKT